MNKLFYGDNLKVMRDSIGDESIDLVYLDPPFNSNANYNVLFSASNGHKSDAQIMAFEDTWHWSDQAEDEYDEIVKSSNTCVSDIIQSLRRFLKENDMMAYLVMMSNRLIELHRVLKSTGSLYLHCDPAASHYLKIVLDGVFGRDRFKSEIIWRRTGAHNKSSRWAPIHDTILFYTKSNIFTWNNPKLPYMAGHVRDNFIPDGSGGYKTAYYGNVLTGSGKRGGESGLAWKGFDPTSKGRHWAIPGKIIEEAGMDSANLGQHAKLDMLLSRGFIKIEPGAAWPMYERSITSEDGPATPDIWAYQPYTEGTVFGTQDGIDADVSWLKPQDEERLGYPTQKPLALLERIIKASSNVGDVVLDPFCGCGTAVHAAQKLKRHWVGIDITHLAISLIEKRMKCAFNNLRYEVHGVPKDIGSAMDLARRDKYQFQWWACSLVDAQPYANKKKGSDSGIDGVVYFGDGTKEHKKIIVSVKGGDNVGVAMIRDLKAVVEREHAVIGVFVTLSEPTRPMLSEASSAGFYESGHHGKFHKIQILTIEGLLDGSQKPQYPGCVTGKVSFKKSKLEEEDGIQPMLI